MSEAPRRNLLAWAQLVRLPNVFTVIADVSAAFLLVAHGPQPVGRFVCIVLAGIALYWAGMILNDVFDVEKDKQQRASRPIPAGDISLHVATRAGWGLLCVGVILAALSGYLPSQFGSTWLPAATAVMLSVMIVVYDGPLKKTMLAPAAMGSCRVLSFLLGASPCILASQHATLFPKFVLGMAAGFGIYIMGITIMARKETEEGHNPNLIVGFLVILAGLAAIALAPRLSEAGAWKIRPDWDFAMLIGLIALPVVLRALRVQVEPSPTNIQKAIRAGILSIIPLAAVVALLGAGRTWGIVIFALMVPAILLATRLRVT